MLALETSNSARIEKKERVLKKELKEIWKRGI